MYTEPSVTLQANRSVYRESLPENWVGRIFDRMSELYGSKFADLWRGTDLEKVRSLWAEKLAGFREMPGAIKEALDSLDSKPYPPTLPEFLSMCRETAHRHIPQTERITYKPTPEEQAKAEEIIRKASESIKVADGHDFKAWAKKLKARHEAGENLSLVQVQAYQEALSEKAA